MCFIWNTSSRVSDYIKYGSLKYYCWKLEIFKQTWTTYWDLSHEESIYRRNLIKAVTQQRLCLCQWHTCVFKKYNSSFITSGWRKNQFLICFPLSTPSQSLSGLHVVQMSTARGRHFPAVSLPWQQADDAYDTCQSTICSQNIQDVWRGGERESNRESDNCVCLCWWLIWAMKLR